jgi:preprotein translocase subunit SecF
MYNPFQDGKYFRYVERAPVWLAISALTIIIGIGAMIYNHATMGSAFKLGLAYTGGESLLLRFKEELPGDGQKIKDIVQKYSTGDSIVQVYTDDPHKVSIKLRIKTTGKDEQENSAQSNQQVVDLKKELGNAYGGYSDDAANPNPQTLEQAFVGPTVGAELIKNAVWALFWGSLLVMLWILFRFGSWPYSVAAIIALIHDVQITMTVTAVMRLEVTESFIAVFLTIIGYSVHDTIVIFDRIRENLRQYGQNEPFPQICNVSLNQTIVRSINTVVTVVIMIIALLVVGGANIRDFLIAMLVGMVSGAYSSVFVATPLMLYFSKGRAPQAATATPVGGGPAPGAALPRRAVAPAAPADDDDESDDEAQEPVARRSPAGSPGAGTGTRTARKQRRR